LCFLKPYTGDGLFVEKQRWVLFTRYCWGNYIALLESLIKLLLGQLNHLSRLAGFPHWQPGARNEHVCFEQYLNIK